MEAAGNDPLRAQEIEERISAVWWERWKVDREARIAAQPRAVGPGRHAPNQTQTLAQRQRFRILPDGQLIAA